MRKLFLLSILVLTNLLVFAQNTTQVEMADTLRSNGKIYTVVAVILTILLGLFFYLILLDRKISKLETSQKRTDKFSK